MHTWKEEHVGVKERKIIGLEPESAKWKSYHNFFQFIWAKL